MHDKPRKPGDLFLDRYLPNATPEEREEAREVLRKFFGFLYRNGASYTFPDSPPPNS